MHDVMVYVMCKKSVQLPNIKIFLSECHIKCQEATQNDITIYSQLNKEGYRMKDVLGRF